MGRKKRPHYRIVVADSRAARDGGFVETLGYYKPLAQPARLVLDLERVEHWIAEGASPSGTVKSLISKARRGGDDKVALGEVDAEGREAKRAERRAAEARAAAEAKAAAEADAAARAAAEAEEAAGEPAAEAGSEPTAEAGADAEAEDEEKSE